MAEHRLEVAEAEALVGRTLMANGVSAANAASVARALIAAELDGQAGHGLSRVAAYAAQARSGKVAGSAVPALERDGTALWRVDAGFGFAFPAIEAAIEALCETVGETGIAAAAIRRSHHCGQLGAHVERLAERGLIGLMVANTPKAMAPWGGAEPLFGTNPIAFAAPRDGAPPLVIDLSLSRVARGKIMAAQKAGRPIPEGWALDPAGRPTTDAAAALKGAMLPAGEAKGAALALIVEVLAASLTGANPSRRASSFFDAEGAPPGVGHLIIAIRPDTGFGARLEELIATLEAQEGARLPGSRRLAARVEGRARGIVIPPHLLAEIEAALPG